MSTLKIEDLMVGDWVNVGGEPARILRLGIAGRNKVKGLSGQIYGFLTSSEIESIPITPEILRKNGFKCVAVGDSGPATPKRNYMRYEKWVLCTQWRDVELFFDRLTKRYKLQGCNGRTFTEVHILQHALRFLNIDKEITL